MKTILYFHGLGSSANSRKFIRLQQVFGEKYQVLCPEWTFTTDIRLLLANLLTAYENQQSIVLIGSSTGCNFAYQLAEKLRAKAVDVNLILINPLMHLQQRISGRIFPEKLKSYMQEIKEVSDCTLILSTADEAIDHGMIAIAANVKVIEIDDNHQVKDIKRLISILKSLLKKKKALNKCLYKVKIHVYLKERKEL